MRPASPLAVQRKSVFSILFVVLILANLASGQSGLLSKKKLAQRNQSAAARAAAAKSHVPPPVTTDTWQGGASGNWSLATNWNNGAITSGENILINLTTAATTDDVSYTIGTLTLSNAGDSVTLNNNVQTTVDGNISNKGTITVNAAGNNTELYFGAPVTLSGTGSIVLTSSNNTYTGQLSGVAGTLLTNQSNITGAGTVGVGDLLFANSGTINANVNGLSLLLDPDTTGTNTNTGTLEANGGGTLVMSNGTWTQSGAGQIFAGNNSAVALESNVSITGGTLNSSGTGAVYGVSGYNDFLTNVTNSGSFILQNNNQTQITGTITNNGTMTLQGNGNNTDLYLTGNITLAGTGTVVMSTGNANNYTNQITGVAGAVLTNSSTITGGGNVGVGALGIVNSGTINANLSGVGLTIQPQVCTGCASTNTGTLEASSGGTLVLYDGTWTNTGGKIEAGTGSAVALESNVTINGGTLTTTGSGAIYGISGYNVFLNNVTNSGTYVLQNNSATELSGTINNTGTITLDAAGNVTELYLTGATTLSGAGSVTLTSTNSNYTGQISGVAGSVLTNHQTINGWGTIGNTEITIANASNGIINSNVSGGNILLTPYTTVASTNAGLIEATNGGTVTFGSGTWTNTGTIEAQAGSAINLYNNASITGGTLESTGTGAVNNLGGYNVFLTGLTLAGNYNIQNNAATEISGTITNNGTINLQAAGNNTDLYVSTAGSNSATLTGTGTVVMGSTNGDYTGLVTGNGGTLTIDQTITGAGNIGNNSIALVNNSTIDANLSPTVTTTALTVQPNTGGMTNTGTLEATNGGTLQLYTSSINNAGGTIQAVGTDSKNNPSVVLLDGSVSITGGTLTTSGLGVIEVPGGYNANLTTLTNNGTLNVLNNGELNTNGTITNNGTISLIGGGNNTYLYAPTNTTLTGTGAVVLTSSNSSYTGIVQAASGVTLTNAETIEGWGTIEDGTFVNNGTVNSNISGGNLLMQSFAAATNTGKLEASNGGTLSFNGSNWTNIGGTITAQTGSAVQLYNSTSITGGILSTVGTGQIYVPGGYQANLTTLTLGTGSALNVQNNGQLNIAGTITNNGTISLQGNGNSTYLYAPTSTTLTGTGSVVLTSSGSSYTGIIDTASGQTLTNDETISGWGTIENGNFVNNGTVNANQSGGLILFQGLTGTNSKTMEASNGGTLAFNGTTWTQTGVGTITAATGSAVDLYNGASITGGTLSTSGTGVIYNQGGYFAYLSNLTNAGTYQVQNNAETVLTGNITNNGTITLNSTGNNTDLAINGAVTLAGTGTVVLGSGGPNIILGTGTTPILTSFNTIEGTGNIGNSSMGFTNDGTLNSNVSGGTLAINVNSSGFTNYNGTTTTLTGGTYIANSGNITFAAGNSTGITTLAANVVEEAGGQLINTTNSGNALTNLTSITSTGGLTTDINFTDGGSFSNAGSLTILGSTVFKVGSLAQISGNTLTGGTYVLDSNLALTGAAQNITTNDANITLAGGTIQDSATTTNALKNLATNAGSLTLANHSTFTTVGNFTNTGSLTVNAGSTFTDSGTLAQISGTTLSGGTFVLGGNLDLATGTANITTNSAVLTLEGGTIFNSSNSSNALANLNRNTDKLTLQSGANFTTVGNFTNGGALTVNNGSTFAINGSLTNYSSGTQTLTGGTFVVGGTLSANNLNIVTDAAAITLNGTGEMKNATTSTNALANLNTISSTGSLTLGVDANFTTAGNFTNSGRLTINSGSTFSVAGTLSNLSSGTLTGGTYTVGGTLQLASANGGITTNAATLTLTGKTAKILDGTSNALASFNNNTGSLTLSSGASLTTAASTFTNSGTVTVAKGTTLTVGGTTNSYTQTAGTTTVDGTLVGHGTAGISVTGGTIQGAGTLKANVSNGAAMNVGDAGKAGLLSITGTYTQLSSGTLNVSIGGTAVGSQYSQLKITGTASLGGTLTAGLVNSFTPTVGQTFTVLTASAVSGTFSNSTIAINGTEHFVVSYTSTSVVLTVVSGAAPTSGSPAQTAQTAQVASAIRKSQLSGSKLTATNNLPHSNLRHSNLRHSIDRLRKALPVAVGSRLGGDHIILASAGSHNNLRGWEHIPATPSWNHVREVAVGELPHPVSVREAHSTLARPVVDTWGKHDHTMPVRTPLAGWTGLSNPHRVPVRILTPQLPRIR